MMTEDEARTKWCPHARCMTVEEDGTAKVGQVARNRLVDAGRNSKGSMAQGSCIASDCMMWQWRQVPNPNFPVGAIWNHTEPMYIEDTTKGDCGLKNRVK